MRTWLVLFVIFFLVRYLLPIVMRWALKAFVSKQLRNGGFVVPPQPQTGPPPAPGQIHVDYVLPKPEQEERPTGFKGGEYVDFEEVK